MTVIPKITSISLDSPDSGVYTEGDKMTLKVTENLPDTTIERSFEVADSNGGAWEKVSDDTKTVVFTSTAPASEGHVDVKMTRKFDGKTALASIGYDALPAAVVPPPAAGTKVGFCMSSTPHGRDTTDVARCYDRSQAEQAVKTFKATVLLYSPKLSNPDQAAAECKSIIQFAANNGVPDLQVHYTDKNEVDRHVSAGQPAKDYIANLAKIAAKVNAVPGCSTWLNITREAIKDNAVESFRISPDQGIGLAVNTYSPGRKKSPAVYTFPFGPWLDMAFDQCVKWGITEFDSWEFGQEVGGQAENGGPSNRPDYISAQVK
jgi:hypothetical protein